MVSKYKVGDEFIAKRNIGDFFTKGRTYTIQSLGWREDSYFLNDDDGRTRHGALLDWLEEKFDPVAATPSAIRTVTRREIVPGTYGGLHLYDDFSASMFDWSDADACRKAANLFNQLAEVLEENAKEAA